MIDPKELRIGSLMRDAQSLQILTVYSITAMSIAFDCDEPTKDGWQAEPIPITPEWLERFGFEHGGNLTSCDSLDECVIYKRCGINYDIDGIALYEGGYRYITSHHQDEYGDNYTTTEVKYIHQLQNLYFALTGVELVLKD